MTSHLCYMSWRRLDGDLFITVESDSWTGRTPFIAHIGPQNALCCQPRGGAECTFGTLPGIFLYLQGF